MSNSYDGGICIPEGYEEVYDNEANSSYNDAIAFGIMKPFKKLVKKNE